MTNLFATLSQYDPGMLPTLCEVWGLPSHKLNDDDMIEELCKVMTDPDRTNAVWDTLTEPMQAAIQMIASSDGYRVKSTLFMRLYGDIRKLGRAQIQKEQPHKSNDDVAETLYYRGLVGEGFDNVKGDMIRFVYIPTDLLPALPLHRTAYENLEDDDEFPDEDLPSLDAIPEPRHITPASTAIVDDMTTLLAYLQVYTADIDDNSFTEDSEKAILAQFLDKDPTRLSFILGIGVSASLITSQEGKAYPRRTEVRTWLNATRAEQIETLAHAWLGSRFYRDMWHVPGLNPDDSGWSYDAIGARNSVMGLFTELVPEKDWMSITTLISTIKDIEPDFQRPSGDYESWYIRNDDDEYLNGFESWDAVEGALIEYYMVGPMHWLGLMNIGEDAVQLTAYGRAMLQIEDWPQHKEEEYPIEIRDDGMLLAGRRANRFDRFQLARFTDWRGSGDPFVYALSADSIQRAGAQGIKPEHIQAFIKRQIGDQPIPTSVVKLLSNWQGGATTHTTLETLIVLRTTAPEIMDGIFNNPVYRRYVGVRLGPMACAVRDTHWEEFRAKLGEDGINVDISGIK
jgi:hypothetical protein